MIWGAVRGRNETQLVIPVTRHLAACPLGIATRLGGSTGGGKLALRGPVEG